MACLREGLLQAEWQGTELLVSSPHGESLRFEAEHRVSMDRFDLLSLPADWAPDTSLAIFLNLFFPDLTREKRDSLLAELENSYLNMALSLQAKQQLGLGSCGQGDLGHWEGKVWCGHPLHPGARLRSGLSVEENRLYGPEWESQLQLPLLSLPAGRVGQVGDFTRRLESLFPSLKKEGPGRVLVPVHPWQAERDLPQRFAQQFASGEFRFSEQSLPAVATMSFRTVILQTEVEEDFHLKLPVAVQTTGATRTVSVASTQNGPKMSSFLGQLFGDPEFLGSGLFHHLNLMAEPASFHLTGVDPDQSRYLSAILRRGPGKKRNGETRWILPVAALLEPRENPLFLRSAAYYGSTSLELFTSYCRCLLPPLAFLCGQLGIALEAHPQNMVVEFRGLPGGPPEIHFWYRDLGGIRLHAPRLARALEQRGWAGRFQVPQFWPGSATATESDRDLSSKFVYSVLQNHLGELIRACTRGAEDEADYWNVVDQVLQDNRGLMGADLEARVLAREWDLKAMWTMRMDSAITEYTFQPVVNPLHQFRRTLA